ncbi:MAG: cation transporter [Pseudomonadales bacterium]
MKRDLIRMATVFSLLLICSGFDSPIYAQATESEKTITFAVKKMNCAACPITVRTAMEKVDGVKSVSVDFKTKSATVTFDPAVTTSEQIGQASTNAGYPATPTS